MPTNNSSSEVHLGRSNISVGVIVFMVCSAVILILTLIWGLHVGNDIGKQRKQYEKVWDQGIGHPQAVVIERGASGVAPVTNVTSDLWYGCSAKTCGGAPVLRYPTYVELYDLDRDNNECYLQWPARGLKTLSIAATPGTPAYLVSLSSDGSKITYCPVSGKRAHGGELIYWSEESDYTY